MEEFKTPSEITEGLVNRVRELRLSRNWTQDELAERAGITAASYRRFEQSGKISLERLLLIASALQSLEGFESVFPEVLYRTLDEIEAAGDQSAKKPRARKGRSS
ncbi:MAG: helix-turn-helix transcriptional regulator [Verrucomicrobiota bacterium]